MPALSPTMDSGSISKWTLAPGDSFIAGDVLCSIETDKASVDFEAQDDGVLAKILIEPGQQDVAVGTPICVVVEETDHVAAFANYVAAHHQQGGTTLEQSSVDSTVASSTSAGTSSAVMETVAASGVSSILLPSARHLSESKGLDATVLVGSGKGGRVTKGDVLKAISDGILPALDRKVDGHAAAPVASASASAFTPATTVTPPLSLSDVVAEVIQSAGNHEDVPNNKMRKIIASRLTQSKRDVPHFYTSMSVNLDNILKLRKQLAAEHDIKVSVNDFIIKCSAMALRDVPQVNATINGDTIQRSDTVDISVAVATPTGLITPIVFNTDCLGLADITNKVKDLAGRAREGKLSPEEYQGGTFSISNLGMFGIDEFSAVINPPQAAILAVGGGSRKVVPTPFVLDAEKQEKPSIQTIMTARLSADRRAVDEATASLFMSAFQRYIEEPELLLL